MNIAKICPMTQSRFLIGQFIEISHWSRVLIGRKLLTELNAKQEETMEMEKGILDEFNVNGEFLIEFPNYDG